MPEYIHKTEEIVEKDKAITFENKTDTDFDVSVGIVFRKSGLYRVSIVNDKVSVEVEQERKHGKWTSDGIIDGGFWICTACKHVTYASGAHRVYKYCPFCGAEMGD